MVITKLNGRDFLAMCRNGYLNLKKNEQMVNDLNVFPVPDGDTGTNMRLTIENGVENAPDTLNIGACAKGLARGMLLGARGNSGVILSQIFKGIANYLADYEEADVSVMAGALTSGYKNAYKVVVHPQEGTILTVAREGIELIRKDLNGNLSINDFLKLVIIQMEETLSRTPDMLQVLKDANVIDSGGQGLIFIFKGMLSFLNDDAEEEVTATAKQAAKPDFSAFNEDSVLEFGYCTEFILQLQKAKCDPEKFDVNELVSYLETIGNSIVALKDESIVKVHVHTMTPGLVINKAQEYGEFLTFKLENMSLQHNEIINNKKEEEKPKKEIPHKSYAIVAVGQGDGITDLFKGLACDVVINGGQTMNPSAEDFIDAFEEVNADHIIVFPNNKNIILSANQAKTMYEKSDVNVIGTRSVAECYYALSMLGDPAQSYEYQLNQIEEGRKGVNALSLTRAICDSKAYGPAVHEGDYIVFLNDRYLTHSSSKMTALKNAFSFFPTSENTSAVIFRGNEATEEEAEEIAEFISENTELESGVIDGGQDVYDFIIGIL